jgi:hypothetical protein
VGGVSVGDDVDLATVFMKGATEARADIPSRTPADRLKEPCWVTMRTRSPQKVTSTGVLDPARPWRNSKPSTPSTCLWRLEPLSTRRSSRCEFPEGNPKRICPLGRAPQALVMRAPGQPRFPTAPTRQPAENHAIARARPGPWLHGGVPLAGSGPRIGDVHPRGCRANRVPMRLAYTISTMAAARYRAAEVRPITE